MSNFAARRAVLRWTWRLVRREWRQQVVVLALITFSVAACIFATVAAFNMPTTKAATLGRAEHRIIVHSSYTGALATVVGELTQRFGPVEAISHTSVPVPGSDKTIDVRAQEPTLPLGAPMLGLRDGRYPTRPSEIALTDGTASTLRVGVGDSISLAGIEQTVVGVVENPADLGDEFILVARGAIDRPESVMLLVTGQGDELGTRPGTIRQLRVTDERVTALVDTGPDLDRGGVALLMLSLDTLAMLLVSLIAAAAFVVVAQRRMRQLGMLAAIGATKGNLRLAMVAHGFAVGLISAVAGNAVAFAAWLAANARLEPIADRRIDPADVPIGIVVLVTLLAVATTTAAAWWPARTIARVPIVRALSGRPPAPTRVHRSATAALALLALGAVVLTAGIDNKGNASPWTAIGGPIAIVLGVLFLCPVAIRVVAPPARRLPVAARLALRDLTRYQARAGSALAAISLGLGIACTAIIMSAAAEPPSSEGNLSGRQLLFRLSQDPFIPDLGADALERLEAEVDRFAAAIGAEVYPLDAAVSGKPDSSRAKPKGFDPANAPSGTPMVVVGSRIEGGIEVSDGNLTYVATPELLRRAGIDPATVAPDVEVVSSSPTPLVFLDLSQAPTGGPDDRPDVESVLRYEGSSFSDVPKTFITPNAVAAHGWKTQRVGWFVEAPRSLTTTQREEARDISAASGTIVTARDEHGGLVITRSLATGAGMLLTLAILAMTIGLIRGEAQRDLQTLTATGATSGTRRSITATTAAALALLGGLLGLAGAYTALIAGYSDDLDPLTRVPTANLLMILIGLPVLAAAGGWLFAGRTPPSIARQALD